MMFNLARFVMLVCGSVLLVLAPISDAQPVYASDLEQLERFLPESSLAVMVIPDPLATGERFRQYLATLASIQPLEPLARWALTWVQEVERSAIPFSDLSLIFQAPLALALLDAGIAEDAEKFSFTFPAFLLAARINDSADALQQTLDRLVRQQIQLRLPSVEFQMQRARETPFWIISNAQFQLAYTFLDHVVLLTTRPELLPQLIERRRHAVDEEETEIFRSLNEAEAHRAAQYPHDIRLHLNLRQLWQKLHDAYHQQCLPLSVPATQRSSLFCESPPLRSLTWLCSLHETGAHERMFWEMGSPDVSPASSDCAPWSFLQTMENGHLVSDRLVPGNVLYYRAWRFDIAEWLTYWSCYLDSFLPASDRIDFALQLQLLEQAVQRRVESELLPAFGHEIAFACFDPSRWLYMRGQEFSPENFPCFLAIHVRQQAPIEALIQSLAAIPVSTIALQGRPAYQLDIPGTITPLRCYAAFIQDFFVIASSQRRLQQIMSVAQQGGSLASLPEYAALSALFAEQRSAQSYFNLKYALQGSATVPGSVKGLFSATTRIPAGLLTESFSTAGGTVLGTGVMLLHLLAQGL